MLGYHESHENRKIWDCLTPKPLPSKAVFTPAHPYASSSAMTQPVKTSKSRPPQSAGMWLLSKPMLWAFFTMSQGYAPVLSNSAATGMISSRVNFLATSWNCCCSSDRPNEGPVEALALSILFRRVSPRRLLRDSYREGEDIPEKFLFGLIIKLGVNFELRLQIICSDLLLIPIAFILFPHLPSPMSRTSLILSIIYRKTKEMNLWKRGDCRINSKAFVLWSGWQFDWFDPHSFLFIYVNALGLFFTRNSRERFPSKIRHTHNWHTLLNICCFLFFIHFQSITFTITSIVNCTFIK